VLRCGTTSLTFPHESEGRPSACHAVPCRPVSSDGVVLGLVAAVQSGFDVRGRLAGSGGIWGRWHLVWSWPAGPPVNEGSPMAVQITGGTGGSAMAACRIPWVASDCLRACRSAPSAIAIGESVRWAVSERFRVTTLAGARPLELHARHERTLKPVSTAPRVRPDARTSAWHGKSGSGAAGNHRSRAPARAGGLRVMPG